MLDIVLGHPSKSRVTSYVKMAYAVMTAPSPVIANISAIEVTIWIAESTSPLTEGSQDAAIILCRDGIAGMS
jgi:hypothetical protein